MKLLVFAFLISSSFANDEHDIITPCNVSPVPIVIDSSDVDKLIAWHGADSEAVRSAPCKTKKVPNSAELLLEINKYNQNAKMEDATIQGVSFKGESKILLDAFNDFTLRKGSFGYGLDEKDQTDIQKKYKINPSCDKVLCALEKIWGKENAYKMLLIKLKYKYNTSEYAFANSSRFKTDELNDVFLGIEDLPETYIGLGKKDRRLTRFTRGYTLASYGEDGEYVTANAVIMLFDLWSKKPSNERQYVIFHELAHNISSAGDGRIDESPKWLEMSGWVKKGEEWKATKKNACYISEYGKENAWEDFAETVSAYRYNGNYLKARCPEKYEFVKDEIYKGLEFLSNKTCSLPDSKDVAKFKTALDQTLNNLLKDNINTHKVGEQCQSEVGYNISEKNALICIQKIVLEQFQGGSSDEAILAAIKKAGIPLLERNIKAVVKDYLDLFLTDKGLSQQTKDSQKFIRDYFNQRAEEIAKSGLPEKLKEDVVVNEKCAEEIWSHDRKKMRECVADAYISLQTTLLPKINFSADVKDENKKGIYDLRNILFKQKILNDESYSKVLSGVIEKNKSEVEIYFYQTEEKLKRSSNSSKGWKQMDVKTFCETNYGSATKELKAVLPKKSSQVPGLVNWCIEKQTKSDQRYIFQPKEIREWLSGM